jgi:glycosyltransferase involved in cell wall biosynthesis
MRILHLGKYYPPYRGGMETVLQNLTEGLQAAGCDVTVVVAGQDSVERCEVLAAPDGGRPGRLVRAAAAAVVHSQPLTLGLVGVLRREITRLRPDVIHVHLPNPLAAAAWMLLRAEGSLRGVRSAVWYHADITRQRLAGRVVAPVVRGCLAGVQGIAVSSDALAEESPVLAPWRDKVAVVPFGIDERPWSAVDAQRDGPFLFVGRLVPYKGLTHLLDALELTPGAELTVVGEGPQLDELRAMAGRPGLAGRVTFAGCCSQAELAGLMARARALVLPSVDRSESFGLVQLEAMAAGVPVLTTDLPTGVRAVGEPDVTCLLAPPADAPALADALRRLQDDAGLRERLGEAGRLRFGERYTRRRMVARLLDWYAGLPAPR